MKKFKEFVDLKESPSDLKKPGQKKKKITTGKGGSNTKVKKGSQSQKKVSKKLKVLPQLSMN